MAFYRKAPYNCHMKILRKIKLTTTLVLALTFCVLLNVTDQVSASTYAFTGTFTDVTPQNKYTEAISSLVEQGIIDGYLDGTFRPWDKINRAEFLKIIIGSMTPTPTGENCFTDVTTKWFAPYICYAKENKIADGYPDGSFKPASNINLAEALKISMGGNLQSQTGEAWFAPYLRIAEEKNYLGNIDQNLSHEISRGETSQLIFNIQNPSDPLALGTTAEDTTTDNSSSGNSSHHHSNNDDDDSDTTPDVTPPNTTTPPIIPPIMTSYSNEYSWDGSFTGTATDFPILGLFDNEYTTLPPGNWDWNDANNDNANYRNFTTNIGTFAALKDSLNRQFGWELIGNTPDAIDYGGAAAYFEGSPGTDILILGKNGEIGSFGSGNLGDGPDILVFDKAHTLDFRTGSSLSGSKHDNDLVIAGLNPNTDTSFDISTTTIHTGPRSDLVFTRDMERSAIDAGNGSGGNTSTIDPADGDDTVIFKGNMLDFRFFGGNGNDIAVWYVDEVKQEPSTWLGPNFFGGGGAGNAIWGDTGTDTLVLVIPLDTKITAVTPTQPGELLVRIPQDYSSEIWWDSPVYNDIYARYCISCGISPANKKTLTLEYNKKDNTVHTGYFTLTDFEILQLGIGETAKVYELNNVNGTATLNEALPTYTPPNYPEG